MENEQGLIKQCYFKKLNIVEQVDMAVNNKKELFQTPERHCLASNTETYKVIPLPATKILRQNPSGN